MNKTITFRILYVAFIVSVFSLQMNAQTTFQKNYQISNFHHFTESVQQTAPDSGFIFQGWRLDVSVPLMKMSLIKTDSLGVVSWKKEYCKCLLNPPLCTTCGTASVMGGCVQQTSDGGYILSGSADDKMVLIKTNSSGGVTWAKTYGSGSYGKYVRQTSDLGYICVGYTGNNLFIVKTNSSGNLQWDRAYHLSPNYNDAATDVDQLNSGDFIVTGYSTTIFNPGTNADTTSDIFILKLNSLGTLQWVNTYGQNSESEEGHAVSKTSDGGYIVTGHTSETGSGMSASDVFIWKFNSSDTPEFQYSYKVGGFLSLDISFGYAAQQTMDGGYALFGVTTGIGLSLSYFSNFMLKLNSAGDVSFSKSYKDSVAGAPISLGYTIWNDGKQLDNGGYLLGGCGILQSGMGLGFKLIRTNSAGSSGCSENTINPVKYNFIPAAESISPNNLATGSSADINIYVSDPTVNEETICVFTPLVVNAGLDYSMCQNSTATLGWSPTASGGTGNYTYSWAPTTYLNDPYVANPEITPTSAGTYTYTVTVTSGSITATDDITITVNPSPEATLDPFNNICISAAPITITGGDPSGGNYYVDGVSSTTFDPGVAGLGAHIISYVLINGFGCSDTAFQPIIVFDPDPTILSTGPYCSDFPPDTLLSENSGGIWSGTGITDPNYGIFNPTLAGPGTFWIKYGFPPPCMAYDSVQITVIKAANANINWPGLLCYLDASVILIAADTGGTWTGTYITNGNTGQFSPSAAGIGSHEVIYTITGQCGDIDTIELIVTGLLDATISDVGPMCSNLPSIVLSAVDSSGVWTGEGITNPALGIFTPDSAATGINIITYSIGGNCGDIDSTVITIYSAPDISAVVTNESCIDAADGIIGLTITGGTPAFMIKWNEDSVSQISNTFTINNLIPELYLITVTDSNECRDTVTYYILESSSTCEHIVYIPNIFSPNGDQINDFLVVRGLEPGDIKEMLFTIYDRWGEKVFESTDITQGWNGEYKNKEMTPGVFAYYFKAVLIDDQIITKKGNITLVR